MADTLEDLAERLNTLETEHEVLSARHKLLQGFLMSVIAGLTEDEDRETFRTMIERQLRLLSHTTLFDQVNDLQDLLAAFNAAMPPTGK